MDTRRKPTEQGQHVLDFRDYEYDLVTNPG